MSIPKTIGVRRIFVGNELIELQEFQKNLNLYKRHFSRHSNWVDKVISEIKNGKRVAYGAYIASFNGGRGAQPRLKLVGSVILKKKSYSGIVEAKGLYVLEEVPNRDEAYSELLEKAEEFTAKVGSTLLVTYVPSNEVHLIDILHKNGFYINEVKISPFKSGEYLYTLVKNVQPNYVGDPYDRVEIARWLIEKCYGFEIKDTRKRGGVVRIHFKFGRKKGLYVGEAEKGRQVNEIFLLDGEIYVGRQDGVGQIVCGKRKIEERKPLIFVFVDKLSDEKKKKCKRRGIVLIDNNYVRNELSRFFAYPVPNFGEEDIQGIAVEIKETYIGFLCKNDKKGEFTYFKGGNLGKFLHKGHKLVMFQSSAGEESRIVGMADIMGVEISEDSMGVWHKFSDKNPLLSESEYRAFVAEKSKVMAIYAVNFREACNKDCVMDEILGEKKNIDQMYLDKVLIEKINQQCFSCTGDNKDLVEEKIIVM